MLQPRKIFAAFLFALLVTAAACDDGTGPPDDPPGFLDGSGGDDQIGLVLNSLGRALSIFHVGDPAMVREVELGTSSNITPVGFAVSGRTAAVPLGQAASVAIIDLEAAAVTRFLRFESGNSTGAAFVDGQTVLVANLLDDYVGRFTLSQAGDVIEDTVALTPAPTDIAVTDGGTALVLSTNVGDDFVPLGESVVTAVDPATLDILGTVSTGGMNAAAHALGPDGLLYVVNTGDFVNPSTLAIIDPGTMTLVGSVDDVGVGAGAIHVDDQGLVYISGFFLGTVVWDSRTRTFVRGPGDPVCAPLSGGGCRGAFDADTGDDGRLFQLFFGSDADGLPAQVFIYEGADFQLGDSVRIGVGPTALDVRGF